MNPEYCRNKFNFADCMKTVKKHGLCLVLRFYYQFHDPIVYNGTDVCDELIEFCKINYHSSNHAGIFPTGMKFSDIFLNIIISFHTLILIT